MTLNAGPTLPSIPSGVSSTLLRSYLVHRDACLQTGAQQATYIHRKLKGTATQPAGTKNRVYTGSGPRATLDFETAFETKVWLVSQPFIRGEQRSDDEAYGIQATQIKQGQVPAIDDAGTPLPVTEDDLITDVAGTTWRITNPVISPEGSYFTILMERFR